MKISELIQALNYALDHHGDSEIRFEGVFPIPCYDSEDYINYVKFIYKDDLSCYISSPSEGNIFTLKCFFTNSEEFWDYINIITNDNN